MEAAWRGSRQKPWGSISDREQRELGRGIEIPEGWG
jgi:hypothetical protein